METLTTINLPAFINDPIKLAADRFAASFKRSLGTRARITKYMEQHNVGETLAPGQETT
jgi:hypothetical protein